MRNVNDGQPPVPQKQGSRGVTMKTFAVRPPMSQRGGHSFDIGPVTYSDEAGDSAHAISLERACGGFAPSKLISSRMI
jgi:hypothetical protein